MTSNDKPKFLPPEKVRAIITLTDQADRQGVIHVSPGDNGEMMVHSPSEVASWIIVPPETFNVGVPRFLAYKLISTWLAEGTGWQDSTRNAMVTQALIKKFQGIQKKGPGADPNPREIEKMMNLFGGDSRALLEDMHQLFTTEPEKGITRHWMEDYRTQRELRTMGEATNPSRHPTVFSPALSHCPGFA